MLIFCKKKNLNKAKENVHFLNQYIPIQLTNKCNFNAPFWRYFDLSSQHPVVYEAEAGYCDPREVANAWVRVGQAYQGECHEGVHVKEHRVTSDSVELKTSQGHYSAGKVIFAVGPKTPFLLNQLNISHNLMACAVQMDAFKVKADLKGFPAFLDESLELCGRPILDSAAIYLGHTFHQGIQTTTKSCPLKRHTTEATKRQAEKTLFVD